MKDIENLLKKLNGMDPISREFRDQISTLLSKHKQQNCYTFLKPGQIARKIWYLLSGFIITSRQDNYGNPIVEDIYGPGSFVTDFISFLTKEPVGLKFSAIGNVEVLQLKYVDYQKLNLYPETGRLTQLITLAELKMSKEKSDLYSQTDEAKIIRLYSDDKVSGLPDKYCASFLHMPLEKYMELKVLLLKSGEIKLTAGKPPNDSQSRDMQKVYEVRGYLLENYTCPDIDNIVYIAKRFNTTKKTLTLNFRKILGTTVHKLIRKLRMEKAHLLFSCYKIPAIDVYKQVGYKDYYYFNKEFKRYYGVSTKNAIAQDAQ